MSRRELRSLTVPANEVLSVLERQGHHAAAADLRARFARIATRPPTGVTRLPMDLVGRVAEFLPERGHLLALRACGRVCRDAVRLAIKDHAACSEWKVRMGAPRIGEKPFSDSSVRGVEARGRVFGGGLRSVESGGVSAEVHLALQSVVVSCAQGRLQKLSVRKCAMSVDSLLTMCRACPLLKELIASDDVPNIAAADVQELSVNISQACPLLEVVSLKLPAVHPGGVLGPIETYAVNFPRLRRLAFGYRGHTPPAYRLDDIQLALHGCVHAVELLLPTDPMPPELVDLLLASPLAGRLTVLDASGIEIMPQEDLINFVRACPALRELYVPETHGGVGNGPDFYEDLWWAQPTIKVLHPPCEDGNDEVVRMITSRFSLTELHLIAALDLSAAAADIIINSPCAQTLRKVDFHCVPVFGSAMLLHLARDCPNLKTIVWENDENDENDPEDPDDMYGQVTRERDLANIKSLVRLLARRGGSLDSDVSGVEELLRYAE